MAGTLALFVGLSHTDDGRSPQPGPTRSSEVHSRQPFQAPAAYLPDWTELPSPATGEFGRQLIVKFQDDMRCRVAPDGTLTARAAADLTAVHVVAANFGLTFAPAIDVGAEGLAALEARARGRSGRAQPDLGGLLEVRLPVGTSDAQLLAAARALEALDSVEFASIQTTGNPPPGDIPPVTPDLVSHQLHLGPFPGQDSLSVLALGLSGSGVRVSDCEYNWNPAHEDLVDAGIQAEPGQTPVPSLDNENHGTAVAGCIIAGDNGYGVTGVAPGASLYTYSEWTLEGGFRRLSAITAAVADSGVGDIVLLEMQTVGVGNSYGPAELDPAVHLITSVATDAGVLVVAAAGNGNQDLDHWLYDSYMAMGDSGALIVGAGRPYLPYPTKEYWSTFGTRVNVQCWGSQVFTTGYGTYDSFGGDPNQSYASGFSGTSSAAALVAGACAVLQERALPAFGRPLEPLEMRALLIDTGYPQVGLGGPIGPAVNGLAAMLAIQDVWFDLGSALPGASGAPKLVGLGTLGPDSSNELRTSDVAPSTTGLLVAAFRTVNSPFLGGILVPAPALLVPYSSDAAGEATWAFVWPAGMPPGLDLYAQAWFLDVTGPQGATASNALRGG